ncbi:plasmid replication protein, CyRepA1 family [Raphidiopsis sp. BLCC-F218]
MFIDHLHSQHLEELVHGSSVNLHLAILNFHSLQGVNAYQHILISNNLPRTNTGIIKSGWLERYGHITAGGWWCSGVDPLNNWQKMEWGCFKPTQPRRNKNGKSIKYEHPPSTPTRVFCLRVTEEIWHQISQRYHVTMPKDITINDDGEAQGFWPWVIESNIPIIICEGVKKAAALLTQGYVAIGIPGITSGYRVIKNEFGKVTRRRLIPDLEVFANRQLSFYICFDFENQPRKVSAINNAISKLGYLLERKNCSVKVIKLPGKEKGVDDFITAKGAKEFEQIYHQSMDLEVYIAQTKPHIDLTITPSVTINQSYLDKICLPSTGLVGVKSAKGTGKTTRLQAVVEEAKNRCQPILLITHRILLGKFLCEKIGIRWGIHPENQSSSSSCSPIKSFGLCVDSLWKLNPQDWQGAIVILDEVEQSLWHLLNSNTCKNKRIKILSVFQQLIATVVKTGGLVIAQDADLSDVSLEYLQGLAGDKITPWVLVNKWKPKRGWDVTFYDSPNPTPLIHQLELDLITGKKCYVTTDSRTGRYSCETIEDYLQNRLYKLKRQFPHSLVVSSQTTNTPAHPAIECLSAINEKITDYDMVFVTPSLGTGISIDVQHFDRVYGIFQGVIPDSEARQALARVRDSVPRFVWCAKRGIGLIGSGSTNYQLLSDWYQENQKENLALLSPLHKIDVDLPAVYDPIHLRTWAKLSARVNSSITFYRQSLQEGLIAEGHKVTIGNNTDYNSIIRGLRSAFLKTPVNDLATRTRLILEIVQVQKDWEQTRQQSQHIKRNIKEIKEHNQLMIAQAVVGAKNIDYVEYQQLLTKHSLTDEQRYAIHKYILYTRYGVPVTTWLKMRDDQGYYSQLLTHYYLTHESHYFHIKDQQEWKQQLFWGEGKVFLPDLKTYTLKVEALRALGMCQFLAQDRVFQENDNDIIWLKNVAIQSSQHINRALGVDISKKPQSISGIKILNLLMGLLGLKLRQINQVYQVNFDTLKDGREEIFAIWQQRDHWQLYHLKTRAAQDKCLQLGPLVSVN